MARGPAATGSTPPPDGVIPTRPQRRLTSRPTRLIEASDRTWPARAVRTPQMTAMLCQAFAPENPELLESGSRGEPYELVTRSCELALVGRDRCEDSAVRGV
ncbi:hypothetical protein GCM10028832_05020 [Streptomyces sparsus]